MIIAVVLGIAWAFGTYHMAGRRGRRQPLWAALGFFFGVFALITLRLLPAQTPATAATV
jgi:hypothetical protein